MIQSDTLLTAPWSDRRSGIVPARPADWRQWHDRDRARIIHSSAFRRLQTKTQVLGMGGSDFHRTRLTHSLETAQIAQGIVIQLAHGPGPAEEARAALPPGTLIEAIALAHDLGHPPFGHGGEVALNWCMRLHGGFEGNAQTLRLIGRLEAHSGAFGLDLSRRTMIGVLKYPAPYSQVAHVAKDRIGQSVRAVDWKPAKCFFDADLPIVEWMLAPFTEADRGLFTGTSPAGRAAGAPDHRTLDTGILELADDIAYGVHDLEDAIALDLITHDHVDDIWSRHRAAVAGLDGAPSDRDIADLFRDDSARKRAIGLLVNFFIVHIRLVRDDLPASPLLAWSAVLATEVADFLRALTELIRRQVINQPVVQMLEYRGQEIVRRLFETIGGDPERFLPQAWLDRWRTADANGASRTICDYIATMTDEQATRNYELLFSSRGSPTFGIL